MRSKCSRRPVDLPVALERHCMPTSDINNTVAGDGGPACFSEALYVPTVSTCYTISNRSNMHDYDKQKTWISEPVPGFTCSQCFQKISSLKAYLATLIWGDESRWTYSLMLSSDRISKLAVATQHTELLKDQRRLVGWPYGLEPGSFRTRLVSDT